MGKDEEILSIEPSSVSFMVSQLTQCYIQLADWTSLEQWLLKLKEFQNKFAQPTLQRALLLPTDINFVMALSKFDQSDYGSASGIVM